MKKLGVSLVALLVAIVLFWGVYGYSIPEPTWKKTVIDNKSSGQFVEAEFSENRIHIAYQEQGRESVKHQSTRSPGTIRHSLKVFRNGREWSKTTIDSSTGSGTYLSMTSTGDNLFVAYQDSSVGSEVVKLANLTGSGWQVEEIDNAGNRGPNVGMYTSVTSIEKNPLVAYHSPQQGLIAAVKTDGSWNYERISDNSGWFTSSASCEREAFLAYSGRNSRHLNVSVFDGSSWQTYELEQRAKTGTSVSAKNCDFKVVYNDPSDSRLELFHGGESTGITQTKFARSGIVEKGGYHISFRKYGEGAFYGYSEEGKNWNITKVGEDFETGEFNDIAVDPAGNIHMVYTKDDTVIHSEFNEGRIQNLRELKILLVMPIVLLLLATFLSTIFFGYRNREQLSKTFHISKYN